MHLRLLLKTFHRLWQLVKGRLHLNATLIELFNELLGVTVLLDSVGIRYRGIHSGQLVELSQQRFYTLLVKRNSL